MADEELLRAEGGEIEQNPKPAGGWGLVPDPLALLSAFVCAAGQPQKRKKRVLRAAAGPAPAPAPQAAGQHAAAAAASRQPAATTRECDTSLKNSKSAIKLLQVVLASALIAKTRVFASKHAQRRHPPQ